MRLLNFSLAPVWKKGSRRRSQFAVGGLVLTLTGGPLMVRYNEQARRNLPPLSQKAQAFCRTVTGSCDFTGQPNSVMRPEQELPVRHSLRPVITVTCQSGGRSHNYVFNAATGRLCGMFADARSQLSVAKPQTLRRITTPQEALQVAVLRLKQMDMIPAQAHFRLTDGPVQEQNGEAWRCNWEVRRAGETTPCSLRIQIDAVEGIPLSAIDGYEMK